MDVGAAPTLPPDLMAAAAAFGDLRIALVVGAGCSTEQPTDLPLSRELAIRAHQRLVDDGILSADDCSNPDDLSLVADAVFAKTGAQLAMVERMDPRRFQNAPPNEGYKCAIALMLEGIIRSIVTLNFDLSVRHALADVGAGDRISILNGPQDWRRLSGRSVIYLHRNVDGDPEDLVLRTSQLDGGWRGGWREIVATAAVTSPICVFVGLGTRASVFAETTTIVRQALGSADVYLVGPGPRETSEFADSLGIDAAHYIQLGWGDFMSATADRTLAEHRRELVAQADAIADANGWPVENIDPTLGRLLAAGIVRLGRARGSWLRQRSEYLPLNSTADNSLAADLVIALAVLERATASEHVLAADDSIEFHVGNRMVGRALLASGGGVMTAETLATKVRAHTRAAISLRGVPAVAILAGTTAPIGTPSPPTDLIEEQEPDDIVTAVPEPAFVTTQELHAAMSRVLGAWAIE